MPMSKGVYNILLYINRINRLRGISVAPGSFVFINTLGNPIVGDCLRGRLDDLLKRHNLQGVSLHRFRHTFATRLFEAKVEMRYIQELLGHSNISMTQRYVHPNEEDKKDKIEQLEAYYSQQLGFSVGLQLYLITRKSIKYNIYNRKKFFENIKIIHINMKKKYTKKVGLRVKRGNRSKFLEKKN